MPFDLESTLARTTGAPSPSDIAARLAALEALTRDQQAHLQAQATELARLRQSSAQPTDTAAPTTPSARGSRRAMLQAVAALSAVGFGAAVGAKDAHADGAKAPASQAASILINGYNLSFSPGGRTLLTNGAAPISPMFQVDNSPANPKAPDPPSPDYQIALFATSAFTPAASDPYMTGAWAHSIHGIGQVASGVWPLQLYPGATATPAAQDAGGRKAPKGALYYGVGPDALWLNFDAANPNWRRVAAANSLGIPYPIGPVRLLDTRTVPEGGTTTGFDGATGAAIAPGKIPAATTRTYRVGGKTFATSVFPATTDLRGLFFNITIIGTPNAGGFATVFDAALASPPVAATVLPGAGAISGNFGVVTVPTTGPNAGNIAIRNEGEARHVIIDAFWYLA